MSAWPGMEGGMGSAGAHGEACRRGAWLDWEKLRGSRGGVVVATMAMALDALMMAVARRLYVGR